MFFSSLGDKRPNFAPETISNIIAAIMYLDRLTALNYRNIEEATWDFSRGINCLTGPNGVGKTNVLDAIHYLSFCRSSLNPIDSQVVRHGSDFFMLEGHYSTDDGQPELIYCGMKAGSKKHFKRGGKEYRRLAEHIGLIPIIMVAPQDSSLIDGQSEERRRLMDMVISQYDVQYMEALMRYNKALQQRNAMLKQEEEPDPSLMEVLEEQMAAEGERLFEKRSAFIGLLLPLFQNYYNLIADGKENVDIQYVSHCQRGPLIDVIRRDRLKDRAVGYSLHGTHRDDLEFRLSGHLMKREGSQGQTKTFAIALKLAQFDLLRQTASHTTPILLLDDIFDKLDAARVSKIISIVSGAGFGQIFITDTDRTHLDRILGLTATDYKVFEMA